jgi:hypothetical protein
MVVEAYVVKRMSTLFILGNDFTDQYQLSLIREEGGSFLNFVTSNCRIQVSNSTIPALQDENRHTFQIQSLPSLPSLTAKFKAHRRAKCSQQASRTRIEDPAVRSLVHLTIPPETCHSVRILVNFPQNSDVVYVEKVYYSQQDPEDIFAAPIPQLPALTLACRYPTSPNSLSLSIWGRS